MFFSARSRLSFVASVSTLALLLASCGDDRTPVDPPCASAFDRVCPSATGGSACVPVTSDPNNCGYCGNRCGFSEVCRASVCVPGTPPVDGGGFDSGPPGACSPACPSTQRCCGTSCVNRSVGSGIAGRTDTSFNHCGACGNACDPATASACSVIGGATVCTCGTRGSPCSAGQECVNDGGGFSCQTLCGTTGAPCAAGTTCCGTGDAAVCIDTRVDNDHCGACDATPCGAGTACAASACQPLCGTAVCTATEMCCADACVPAGVLNCGACGVACAAGDSCGTLISTTTVCCGIGFIGLIMECTVPDVDGGVPDAGDADAGVGADAGEVDASSAADAGDVDLGG